MALTTKNNLAEVLSLGSGGEPSTLSQGSELHCLTIGRCFGFKFFSFMKQLIIFIPHLLKMDTLEIVGIVEGVPQM